MRLSEISPSGCSLPWVILQLLVVFSTHSKASLLSDHASIQSAAVKVPPVSVAGTPYFEYETQQLTEEVIKSIEVDSDAAEYISLFDFDNGAYTDTFRPSTHKKCKVFPGDEDWPSEKKWNKFDKLLGNALIPTTPLAAPCYPSWGEYSAEKCEEITAKWSDAYFQYACLLAFYP